MKLKTCNAILGLAIILALFLHTGTMIVSLVTGWYNLFYCKLFAHIAAGLLIAHVLISLCVFFFSAQPGGFRYPRHNLSTVLQRFTALLMLVLIHFHLRAYAHMATGEVLTQSQALFTAALEGIFILSVFIHIAVSLVKALVTLGLTGSFESAGKLEKAVWVFCAIWAAAALYGVLGFFL